MKVRTRTMRCFIASIIVASAAMAAERQVLEGILVRVNDEIVTISDFRSRLAQELAQIPEKPTQSQVGEYADQLLENVVNEMVLIERAREKNIVPEEGAVDGAIEGMREENSLQDDMLFQAALKEAGLTEETLRERYARSFMIQRAAQGEIRPTEITTEELRWIYEEEKEEFAVPAKIELEQMIFPVDDGGSNEEEVIRRAEAMLDRVKQGADLKAEATLAGVELQALGAIPEEDLRPELRQVLATVGEGEFTAPFASVGGVQVLRLVRRIPAGYQPFEEVEPDIRRRESERLFFEQRSGFIDLLKQDYLVEVHKERMALVLAGISSND
jgi:parvulin-like peptidyl-prolyl isomerase